jgi:hypothetical protein
MLSALTVAAAVVAAGALGTAPVAAGNGTTLYVDGKTGSDTASGLAWESALRTINRAATKVPRGSAAAGWTIVVRGYADHVYRERPVPGGYDRWGASGTPLVFQAEGWSAGGTGYVRPIVSGGLTAPAAGESWQASGMAGVWWTSWSTAPRGFDPGLPYYGAIFQDTTTHLWQRASLADLADTVGDGLGGYWYDASADRLYVATRSGVDPASVSIEVPMNNGFYFSGAHGAKYIQVRGFEIRHAAMAIAFVEGTDDSRALDNVLLANSHIGIHVAGRATGSTFDAATGNQLLRNEGAFNTVQAVKVDAGAKSTKVCDNVVHDNLYQGIKVQGPSSPADPRRTTATEVCRNEVFGQDVTRLEQDYDNGAGITVADGALTTDVHDNRVHDNHVGIHLTQRTGSALPLDGTTIRDNLVWSNDRFGANFRDGVVGSAAGRGTVTSSGNLYWVNGVGIHVAQGSTNKVFEHETAFDNLAEGFKVGCSCSTLVANATFRESLSTHNGTWGVAVMAGHTATIAYVGLGANGSGASTGSMTKTAVNTKSAGYLSTSPTSADYLRIGPASYQYTAGPSSTPVGARW